MFLVVKFLPEILIIFLHEINEESIDSRVFQKAFCFDFAILFVPGLPNGVQLHHKNFQIQRPIYKVFLGPRGPLVEPSISPPVRPSRNNFS